MKRILLCFALIVTTISCKPKEKLIKSSFCNTEIKVQYDGKNYNRNTKPKISKGSKFFTVIFLSEYKDSIRAYVDEKLTFNEFVDQRDYDDSNSYNFGKYYSKKSEAPNVKIESLTRKSCFDFKVDKRYSFIYVWALKNGIWQIRYSNSYYIP